MTRTVFTASTCETKGFTPDDIRTNDDLERIPLLPDLTFKMYPSGVDFASWLGNIYTGKLPSVDIKSTDGFDDVIEAFNTQGLVLAYSTGTNGQYSVIPRDELTYNLFLYKHSPRLT